MKKLFILILAILLTSCSSVKSFELPDNNSEGNKKHLVDKDYLTSINHFSRDLIDGLYNEEDNMNVSPLSIHMILSLLGQGADGSTKDEINKVLYLDKFTDKEIKAENKKIYENNYINKKISKLLLANSIWQDKKYEFIEDFINTSNDDYHAQVFNVDFKDLETNKKINNWVLDKTNNKLNPEYEADPDTIMVLMNAVYLLDEWKLPFDEMFTEFKDFRLNSGKVILVETMQMLLDDYNYLQTKEFTKVALDLKEVDSVEIILPNEGYNVKDLLEESIYQRAISDDITGIAIVDIKLPKVEIESKYLLNDVLKSLGINDAFDMKTADFSKITKNDLAINRVIHQTFFAFDEKEVEAGAVTITEINTTSAPVEKRKKYYFT